DVTEQQLAGLVSEPNGTTSIYAMKQFAQGLGLYCRAVRTDIDSLKQLNGCQAILHIPGKEHFVVFDGIDDNYVWTIDLADNEFYYRSDIDFFGMDWTEGTVLLVSNQPIDLQGNFTDIDDAELQNIVGAEGYACTRLYQTYNVIYCAEPVGGICGGYYKIYRERWGCQADESGSCKGTNKERMRKALCIEDPYDPLACDVKTPWYIFFMLACS
ncbi:MAG: cysteine peptidase family C39 domain-containing protein, partial [Planctomycetota bacterium]